MRTAKVITTVFGAVAFFSATATAYATTYISGSGSMCQPQMSDPNSPSTSDPVAHIVNGAANPSTTKSSTLICPLTLGTQSFLSEQTNNVYLLYKDFSSTDFFVCSVNQGFDNGSVVSSSPKYTCSVSGGCPDPTTSYTGQGTLKWSGSAELGAANINQNVAGNYTIACAVPKNSGGGSSFIITYYATN